MPLSGVLAMMSHSLPTVPKAFEPQMAAPDQYSVPASWLGPPLAVEFEPEVPALPEIEVRLAPFGEGASTAPAANGADSAGAASCEPA